jgi:hypothetical protein
MMKKPFLEWSLTLALGVASGQVVTPGKTHAAPEQSHEQIAGAWLIDKPVFALRTADGGVPPLKPAAAKVYQDRQAARAKGDTSFDSATWCASLGMPRMLLVNYPFEVIVRPKQVALLHQWNWWARLVYMPNALDKDASAPPPPGIGPPGGPPGAPPGGPPGAPPGGPPGAPPGARGVAASGEQEIEPTSTGFSQGKWEGDVLVVETDHIANGTLLDSAGMPHSSHLKLVERIRVLGTDVLEDRIRIQDDETFVRPWETLVTYRRQAKASRYEDVCLDRIRAGEPAVREQVKE